MLRGQVTKKYPDASLRLLPTIYIDEHLINKFDDIEEKIAELRKDSQVNEQ